MANFKKIVYDLTPPLAWRSTKRLVEGIRSKKNFNTPDGASLIRHKKESVKGVFVHIHKCAGTSLIDSFVENPYLISCIARPGVFPGRTGRDEIPNEIFNRCFKFTFVRNPYARLVSAYKMFKSSLQWKDLFSNFDDFIRFIQWTNVHEHEVDQEYLIDDFVKRVEDIIHHCSSFHNPKYMIDQMDYIGRLETLEDDLEQIAEILMIPPISVKHLNKHSRNYNYRDYYSSTSKQLVSNIYKKDIERFEYLF